MNIDLDKVVLLQMMFAVLHIEDMADGAHLTGKSRYRNFITNTNRDRNLSHHNQDIQHSTDEAQTSTVGHSKTKHQKYLHAFKNLQDNAITDSNAQRRRRSPSICPQDLIYGSCPNIIDYPRCNMYHIISVCPWKIENTVVKCLTKTPCYGIHTTFQNLECHPVDGGCNSTDVPAACIAVKPTTKQARTESVTTRTDAVLNKSSSETLG